MNFMAEFAKNRWNLYRLNSIYYCFSSEKFKLYWFGQVVQETKIDFDNGSGPEYKTRFDRGSEPNQSPPHHHPTCRPCPRMLLYTTILYHDILWLPKFYIVKQMVLRLQTHQMDLAGYANEACIGNAICLGRKLALWEARAVSNTCGPHAGAPQTQQWHSNSWLSCCSWCPNSVTLHK